MSKKSINHNNLNKKNRESKCSHDSDLISSSTTQNIICSRRCIGAFGPRGATGASGPSGPTGDNYMNNVYAVRNTGPDFPITNVEGGTNIILTAIDNQNGGWVLNPDGSLVVPETGLYQITYQYILVSFGEVIVSSVLRVNDIIVPNTQQTQRTSAGFRVEQLSFTFHKNLIQDDVLFIALLADQEFGVVLASSENSSIALFGGPLISASLTIERIM